MDKSIERFDSGIEIPRELNETDQSIVQAIDEIAKEIDNNLLSGDEREQTIAKCNKESSVLPRIQDEIDRVHHLYYEEGFSMLKVAKRLGYKTAKPVQRIFRMQNWVPRNAGPRRNEVDLPELKRLYYEEEYTISDLAGHFGVDTGTIKRIFKKENMEIEQRVGIQRRSQTYPVSIWLPRIGDQAISNIEELTQYIKSNAPGLLLRDDFNQLTSQAEVHLRLVQMFEEKMHLYHGEINKLAEEFKIPIETMRYYLRKAGRPRIYYFFDEVSMDERTTVIEEFCKKLNGVTSVEEMDRRLKTLFFYDEFRTATSYEQYYEFSAKYFRFWDEYSSGGLIQDIATRLEIGRTTANEWMVFSQIPTYANYASLIPEVMPSKGWKYLPLKLNTITNEPESFIEVPLNIRSKKDIIRVVKQLKSLEIDELKQHETQFETLPRHLEFMYLLGLITSDGGFSHNIESSANIQLSVGKKYSWGHTLGKGFCYAMGVLGVSTSRWVDDIRIRHGEQQVCMVWGCETSPFFAWIERTLLGLDPSMAKSTDPISADWILRMPYDWRVAFIQGLADGDGWASIRGFSTGISTLPNREFIKKLFTSLGIVTKCEERKVTVGIHNEIPKAQELPLFRYAKGRQKRLDILSKIIKRKSRRKATPDELKLIFDLHEMGHTPGEITEILWKQHDIARSPGSIYCILDRN